MNPDSQTISMAADGTAPAHPKPRRINCLRRATCFTATVVFFLISIIGADYMLTKHLYEIRREKEIKTASEALNRKAEGYRDHFIQETDRIRGIPVMIGDEKQVIDVLVNVQVSNNKASSKTGDTLKGIDRPDIAALNRHLDVVAKSLGYDAVWVMDIKGVCLASSNSPECKEPNGVNYADRIFFKQAMAGERGFQYTVEQQVDKPGLYFSAPVHDGKSIVGVVVIKLPASRLRRFVDNDEVFITEENGIIIAAHDPEMVMKSTDSARLELFSKDKLLALYKKSDFIPLNIRPAGLPEYPNLMQVDDRPGYYLFSKCTHCDCGLSLQTYTRISRLDEIESEAFMISLVAIMGGAAVLLLIVGIVAHIHRIRRDNEELQTTEIKLLALNRELDAQRQIAEQASRTKSEFLANMSHEIRTPLNGVLATAELFAKMDLDDRQRNYLEIIRSSGELLLIIINDILDLSKIEAGKIDFNPACLDLRHEAEIAASLFAAQAKAKDLRFGIDVSGEVPHLIVADPYRLRQVVANLVSNAIKYTDRGSVEARFSLSGNKENPRIRFAVKDTGPGVPQEAQKFIFEKFTQINRLAAINGTGLGLPICQALVEMMDGKIGVESNGVDGSVFWFEIPLAISTAEDVKGCETNTNACPIRTSHKGCRVLIVEDIEINRFVISEMLVDLGCVVEAVSNGKSALEMMSVKTYDAVFMDCSMPVMNGYDATREIRKKGDTKTPVIALTAHSFPEEIEKCLSSGMNDFISKPVKQEYLASALDKWRAHEEKPSGSGTAVANHQPAQDTEAFDASVLNGWYSSMPEKTGKFIELTLKDSARIFDEITRAIAAHNAAELTESAHALKSVARQIGGNELSRLCGELEVIGKNNGLKDAEPRLEEFRSAYKTFFEAIKSVEMNNEGIGKA
ncbi:MAG: response regulator [Alphaproteobacteria bacterium]|nr:response regulator [Alphaproteobacteria bacterium]